MLRGRKVKAYICSIFIDRPGEVSIKRTLGGDRETGVIGRDKNKGGMEAMLKGKKICIIGGGKMGEVLAKGITANKLVPAEALCATESRSAPSRHFRNLSFWDCA